MEEIARPVRVPFRQPPVRIDFARMRFSPKKLAYRLVTFGVLLLIWHLAALHYHNPLLLPSPLDTFLALIGALGNVEIMQDLLLTMQRVLIGLSIALIIGLSVGFAMGYSKIVNELVDPIIGPLRQVPIMAWVPLTIVWFGLGEGPTLFLIAMVATFPIMLNAMAGVRAVPQNYYDAARSMGAGRWSIFSRITLPGALPDVITGVRIGLSAGWMSVI